MKGVEIRHPKEGLIDQRKKNCFTEKLLEFSSVPASAVTLDTNQ